MRRTSGLTYFILRYGINIPTKHEFQVLQRSDDHDDDNDDDDDDDDLMST